MVVSSLFVVVGGVLLVVSIFTLAVVQVLMYVNIKKSVLTPKSKPLQMPERGVSILDEEGYDEGPQPWDVSELQLLCPEGLGVNCECLVGSVCIVRHPELRIELPFEIQVSGSFHPHDPKTQ